jgi:hypothetical protein
MRSWVAVRCDNIRCSAPADESTARLLCVEQPDVYAYVLPIEPGGWIAVFGSDGWQCALKDPAGGEG